MSLNYVDQDDDGDGVLTINEDANGDGNPANDFNDTNNPIDYKKNHIHKKSSLIFKSFFYTFSII